VKRLLYCVFQHNGTENPEVVHNQSLAVATSPWPEDALPDMASLQAYEKAIATVHATRTVIPLRFGCVMEDPWQILQMLDQRQAEFRQLLGDLDGLAEMGLRVWWKSGSEEPVPLSPGARFLAAVRGRQSGLLSIENERAGQICGSLKELYVREKREARPAPGGRLVSMHFLVPRAAAEDFRQRVRHLAFAGDTKFMLSGPWPPYNFVDHA
jgi:Gas vesicle synthesis protein GvpL/GvpF